MRTTLNIDDELIREAKIAAIREGITLTEYIERALAHKCSSRSERQSEEPWGFPVRRGHPIPGFPWEGSLSEMLEFLEGPDELVEFEGPDADSGR